MEIIETANRLQAAASKKDIEMASLMACIEDQLKDLDSRDVDDKAKYRAIVSVEFLLFKLRTLIEFESITVKKLLNSDQLIPAIKTFFVKRDVYLAQFSQKLTTIQNDISNISRLVYQQNFNK